MHCVRVRSGRTSENPAFPDRAEPDRQHQVAARARRRRRSSADTGRGIFDLERAADRNRVSSGSWTRCCLSTVAGMSGRWLNGFAEFGGHASRSNAYEANSNCGARNLQMVRWNTIERSASFAVCSNSPLSHSETPVSPFPTRRAHSTYSSRRLTGQSGGGLAVRALTLLVLSASVRIFARGDFSLAGPPSFSRSC